jgi:hypothetical protein
MHRLGYAGISSSTRLLHTSCRCNLAAVSPNAIKQVKGKGKDGKERLVILGSGWGCMTLLKNLDEVSYVRLKRYEARCSLTSFSQNTTSLW